MSKKDQQERIAVELARRDAKYQSLKSDVKDLELVASDMFLAQYEWYMQRAARLQGRLQ